MKTIVQSVPNSTLVEKGPVGIERVRTPTVRLHVARGLQHASNKLWLILSAGDQVLVHRVKIYFTLNNLIAYSYYNKQNISLRHRDRTIPRLCINFVGTFLLNVKKSLANIIMPLVDHVQCPLWSSIIYDPPLALIFINFQELQNISRPRTPALTNSYTPSPTHAQHHY